MNRKVLRLAAPSAAIFGAFAGAQAWGLEIEVLSSMPELVSGGDALVRITDVSAAPTVTVGGQDKSGAFVADATGGWVGLVDGLADGANELTASAGGATASVTLQNHGINATLFAGPQQTPYLCENETYPWWGVEAEDKSTCAAPTVVEYKYLPEDSEDWMDFDPNGARPEAIATAETTNGDRVPAIIRQEMGVINRAAYTITMLHDPAASDLPTPANQTVNPGWNQKLVYCFGGGVQAAFHMNAGPGMGGFNGSRTGCSIPGETPLMRGYAVASGSLNRFGGNNNHVTSGELMAKVKEHFIEEFGAPLFTIGVGASGGSMQQNLIGNNYPGLMDGTIPERLYADTITFLQPLYDCELLENVFDTSERSWTTRQMTAVSGMATFDYCTRNGSRYPNARPGNCNGAVADAAAFDPAFAGVRCTYQDNLVNIFGTDPSTGFARNPFDNVGVQYGLKAFNAGTINFDEFVEINSRIGGLDVDGAIMPERQVGDLIAIQHAYASGAVNEAGAGLNETAIFDVRTWHDVTNQNEYPTVNVDVHNQVHSQILHDRLMRANGNTDNVARLITVNTPGSVIESIETKGLQYLDQWLTAVINDHSGLPKAEVIRRNRPAEFVDSCYTADNVRITDWNTCMSMFPYAGHPRMAAGGPSTDDVMKCALKPVTPGDYNVTLTSAELDTLRQVFPDGVCDYSKPGIGQTALAGTWIVYEGDGAINPLQPLN
jgi:hypothetical protein